MDKYKKFLMVLLSILLILYIVWFIYSHVLQGIIMWNQLNYDDVGDQVLSDYSSILQQIANKIEGLE